MRRKPKVKKSRKIGMKKERIEKYTKEEDIKEKQLIKKGDN